VVLPRHRVAPPTPVGPLTTFQHFQEGPSEGPGNPLHRNPPFVRHGASNGRAGPGLDHSLFAIIVARLWTDPLLQEVENSNHARLDNRGFVSHHPGVGNDNLECCGRIAQTTFANF
jgi:hypothetical protein